jgi:curved DNA-binding protein
VDYKDYYSTLGVSRQATQQEIQKAYKKLARKLHPDVNKEAGGEARFRELAEAYEVLKDSEKRAKYDRYGSAWKAAQQGARQGQRPGARGAPAGFEEFEWIFSGGGPGGAAGGFDFATGKGAQRGGQPGHSSFFDMLFGGLGGPGTGGQRAAGPRRGADHEAVLELTLEEAMRGGSREIALTDPESGATQRLRVAIPKGVRDGQRIRLAGKGGSNGKGQAGDLLLKVGIAPHPRFRLEGKDLHADLPVAPWTAALGGDVAVTTPEGVVTVRIPAGSPSGRKIRLRGKGFPASDGAGDLLAEVRIVVPTHLSAKEKELFEELAKTSAFEPR